MSGKLDERALEAAATLKHFAALRWPDDPSHDDLMKHIQWLETLLQVCAAYVETYSDVSDGPDGEPVPNRAMAIVSLINEALT